MIKKSIVFFFEAFFSLRLLPLRLVEIVGQLFPEDVFGCKVRGFLYRPFLRRCGTNFQVALSVKMEHLKMISVGDHVYIGHGSWISGLRGGIVFENEVMIGPYVKIVSSNHTFRNGSSRFAPGVGEKIVIGFGTWIASGVTVTSGVCIGRSCLIASGAVVTRNTEDYSIMGGVPAKLIGSVLEKYPQ